MELTSGLLTCQDQWLAFSEMHRKKSAEKTCIKLLVENGCVVRLTRLVYRYLWASNLRLTERFHERHIRLWAYEKRSVREKKTIPEYLQFFFLVLVFTNIHFQKFARISGIVPHFVAAVEGKIVWVNGSLTGCCYFS